MSFREFTSGAGWRVRRSRSALVFALVVATSVGAFFAGPATAGVVTQPGRATIKASGLTVAERRAITITSVSAAGDGSLGLVVTVTFRGDVERYLGQGHLKHGLLALVLVPRFSARSPTGLVDEGGGFAGMRFPILERHGKQVTLKRGTVDVFSPEHVLRMTTVQPVSVIRDNNQVIFYVAGPELSHVAKIKLEAFTTSPTGPGHRASIAQTATSLGWREVLHSKPTALASLNFDPSRLTCGQLEALRKKLSDVVSFGVEPELRHEEEAHANLLAAIDNYSTITHVISQNLGLAHASKRQLIDDLRSTAARIGHLKAEIANVENLIGQVGALIKACAPPPPTTTATTTITQPSQPTSVVEVVQTDPRL